MNSCNFIGRIGRDAAVRYTQGGKSVTGWSLAVDTGFGDNKATIWLDCSAWGERFEKIAQYLTKGSQVGVTGEIGTREHDDKTYVTLRVAEVTLVGGRQDTGNIPRNTTSQRPSRQSDPVDDFDQDSEITF